LKDATAVNATRFLIYHRLQATLELAKDLPIEIGTGGLTKFNRIKKSISPLRALVNSLPKTHWLDAVCVGKSTPETLKVDGICPLTIVATGHGSRQMSRMDRFGFPRTSAKQFKRVHGFQTGDILKAVVPVGKKSGTYIGSAAIRTSGSFNLKTETGTIQGINYRYCYLLQHADGYSYEERGTALPPTPLNGVGSAPKIL
jgi:hypothetical protein